MSHGKMRRRKFGGDAGLGQATCKPRSQPSHPHPQTPSGHFRFSTAPKEAPPPHSSQSFLWVGENIWQPLGARPLFVLQASLSSHKRLTMWLFEVRFKTRVAMPTRVWKLDTKIRKMKTMWKSSPYFLWWLFYKRNILVVSEKPGV